MWRDRRRSDVHFSVAVYAFENRLGRSASSYWGEGRDARDLIIAVGEVIQVDAVDRD
jgi:hypothetical protein